MKNLIVFLAASLILIMFTGCKKIDTKNFWPEIGNIIETNENDCAKAADEVGKFFDKNGDAWADAVIEEAKAQKMDVSKAERELMEPKEIVHRIKEMKCLHDPNKAVKEIFVKKYNPLERRMKDALRE